MASHITDPVSALAEGIAFAAERFRDDRDNLRRIADAMLLPLAVCNRDFTYRWVSSAYADWVGSTADRVVGRQFIEILGSSAVETLRPHWGKC